MRDGAKAARRVHTPELGVQVPLPHPVSYGLEVQRDEHPATNRKAAGATPVEPVWYNIFVVIAVRPLGSGR